MRSIMSALIVLVMVFTVVSAGVAATNGKDADRPGNFPTGHPYPCIASPAYADYTDAKNGPCPVEPRVTPDPMGSW